MKRFVFRVGIFGLVLYFAAVLPPRSLAVDSSARPEPAIQIRTVLSMMCALADSRIEGMANALTVAAQAQDTQSLEWDKLKPLLAAIQKRFGPANVWFARPDGSYFTVDKGLTDKNLKDRPYFPKVMAGETSVGELVVSRATGGNTVIAAVPIIKEGKTIGMLGASIYLEKLAQQLKKAAPLPAGVVFYALDSKGQIALHTQEGLIFQEAVQMGSPTLTEAVKHMLANPEGVVAYEFAGGRQKALFQTSAVTGWKFAIRFPAE
jgi:C4-dicarboxylate-specific signal transduction histidine kinase